MMSATAEATVAAAQWEGHADRRKPEYLLMSTIHSTELPGLGAKFGLTWNEQPLLIALFVGGCSLSSAEATCHFVFYKSDAG